MSWNIKKIHDTEVQPKDFDYRNEFILRKDNTSKDLLLQEIY